MRSASPAARPRQARKAMGPGIEISISSYLHLRVGRGPQATRDRLEPHTGVSWVRILPISTLGGGKAVHGKPETEPNLEWRRPQVEMGPQVEGQRGKKEVVTPVTELMACGARV